MGKILDVQRNLYGLGISPLSIENRASALDEELLSNKKIGLFGINTNKNNIVSAEYLSRSKKHLDKFINKCISENIMGNVYKIVPDNKIVQVISNNTVNILNSRLSYEFTVKPKAVKFSFDIDIFDNTTMGQFDIYDIQCSIQYLDKNNKAYQISSVYLYELFEKSYSLSDLPKTNNNTYWFKLESIGFSLPATVNVTNMTIVLYDILMAFA